jgi:Domain of unknown function (DUF4314)
MRRSTFKKPGATADIESMDPHGAKLLAARIRAGVSIGTRIELVGDLDEDSRLCAGDRGVVHDIGDSGLVVVNWDRGFTFEIDPAHVQFRPLAA